MSKPIVLCFIANYLPGYRAGGPIRAIANLVEHLSEDFDFRLVTRDRDMGSATPYSDITNDSWITLGRASVRYLSADQLSLYSVAKLIRETAHDLLYLNSFFDFRFTILPLLARYFKLCPKTPCLLAPRGEFSSGALALREVKKRTYMRLARHFTLYSNIYWQASSNLERADIIREFGSIAKSISVAADLTDSITLNSNYFASRDPGNLRLIFLSRISPMKNLDFLLRVLGKISTRVSLAVFGPKEDIDYWGKCNQLRNRLPKNIDVTIGDHVPHSLVRDLFSEYDLFAFPTRGENFGHVIFEALSAGTPVLLSDQTPWQPDVTGAVQMLPLVETLWAQAIAEWSRLDRGVLIQRRKAALEYAQRHAANNLLLQQNLNLFHKVLGSSVPATN